MPTTNLIVDGVTYTQSSRKTNSLVLDYWSWDIDNDFACEFHEVHRGPTPKYPGPKVVSVTVDGVTRFKGDISADQPALSQDGRQWGYRCLGLKYRANYIPVTATDGSGVIVYNLPGEDEYYVPSMAGKSIGAMTAEVLASHATPLTAAGITTDATTASQLAALTLVPQERVYYSGERLWLAMEAAFQRWARNHRLIILPTGLVRVVDTTAGTTRAFTIGTDPVDPPAWVKDWTHCATRVIVRGKGRIRPTYVSILGGELQRTWTNLDETNWKYDDFDKPGDAYDIGAVTSVLGSNSVRVNPTDNTRTWPVNFWSDRKAWIYLKKTTGLGLQYREEAPVTSCTALTAGGTSDLTLGLTLDNQGVSDYNEYTLIGKVAPAGVGRVNVYRLYNIVTPGNWIEQHLVSRFPAEVPFVGYTGLSAVNTLVPMAQIIGPDGSGNTDTFRIIPQTGQILFDRPVVRLLNQPSVLDAGGAGVVKPADIYALLAYSRGALEAIYPPNSGATPVYSGSAFSPGGLSRTLYADVESWQYEGSQAQQTQLAQMLHQSVCDTVIEGSVRYYGAYSNAYDPSGGHMMQTTETDRVTGGTVVTNVPVRAFTLRYLSDGQGTLYMSEFRCSSRRDPRTDESQYLHSCQLGSGGGMLRGTRDDSEASLAMAQAGAMGLGAMGGGNPYTAGMGAAGAGAMGGFAGAAAGATGSMSTAGNVDAMGGAVGGAMGSMMAGGGGGGGGGLGGGGGGGGRNRYRRKRTRSEEMGAEQHARAQEMAQDRAAGVTRARAEQGSEQVGEASEGNAPLGGATVYNTGRRRKRKQRRLNPGRSVAQDTGADWEGGGGMEGEGEGLTE